MGLIDNVLSLFITKPAPPALPGPGAPTELERADSFENPVTSMGTAFDKSMASAPSLTRRRRTRAQLNSMYRWNHYAKKIVDWLPDQSVRKGWDVNDSESDSEGEDSMHAEDKRLSIPERIADGARWGRLYGGSLVIVVTDDNLPSSFMDDNEVVNVQLAEDWLTTELDLSKVVEVLNLIVVDETEYEVVSWDADLRSKTYREPLVYRVNPRAFGGRQTVGFKIHASRTLWFGGSKIPDAVKNGEYRDDSILDAAYDAIRGKSTTDNAGEVLAQEAQIPVFKVAGLPAKGTGFAMDAFMKRMSALAFGKSLLNALVLGKDEEYTQHPSSLSGWADLDTKQQERLASAADMPVTELFGTAPTGMNTDGEAQQRKKAESIASFQEKVLRENLERLYEIIYSSSMGPTGGTVPDDWELKFLPVDEPSAKVVAETNKLVAETDQINVETGVYTARHVALSRNARQKDGLLPVNPDEVKEKEEEDAANLADAMAAAAKLQGETTQQAAEDRGKKGEQTPVNPAQANQ